MQQVALGGAFFDRALNRAAQHDEAHAVLLERGIDPGLIERKRVAVAVAVERCSDSSIERHRSQPQPAALERQSAHVFMERYEVRMIECIRSPTLPPALEMKLHKSSQRLGPLCVGVHRFNANLERLVQVAYAAPEVIAMLGADAAQIRIPRAARQINERTDLHRNLETF